MGITDALATVGTSAMENIGNVEKAIIEILDLRNRDVALRDAVRVAEGGGGLAGGMGNLAGGGLKVNKGLIKDVVGKMLGEGSGAISDVYYERLSARKKQYEVQFNPSSLRLSGHNGGPVNKMDYNAEDAKELGRVPVKATISLSVDLLFDSMDPKDAFMGDKADLSLTGIAKGAADLGLSLTGKKKKTIQREVEGFIAALRNENTRLITFHWGDLCYSGVLMRVGVEYTMFNVTGEPVRAKVGLAITCADAEQWPNSVAIWQQLYKEVYKNGNESYVKTSQKYGNLLNL